MDLPVLSGRINYPDITVFISSAPGNSMAGHIARHAGLSQTITSTVASAAFLLGCATSSTVANRTIMATITPPGDTIYSSPIVELRQYTLHPGRRDDLIRLFDSAFVEPQERTGIRIIGQFRNLDDPYKFVWLRGFSDMVSRKRQLAEFYGGNAWRSRRNDANATIIDNDNVLLLRPVRPDAAFDLRGTHRAPVGTDSRSDALVVATIYHLDPTPEKERDFVQFFQTSIAPALEAAGVHVLASFVSEQSANTFPGLPVREREPVFVWFARFTDVSSRERAMVSLASSPIWRDSLSAELSARVREPFVLRLSPTSRSLLR